jgi:hypothetical protein
MRPEIVSAYVTLMGHQPALADSERRAIEIMVEHGEWANFDHRKGEAFQLLVFFETVPWLRPAHNVFGGLTHEQRLQILKQRFAPPRTVSSTEPAAV